MTRLGMPCPRRRVLASFALLLGAGCGSTPRQEAEPVPSSDPGVAAVRAASLALGGHPADYDSLLAMIGDADVVLLGESTHGTREFYRERARITHRLIQEKGFSAVVLEADWTPSLRVNRYVRGWAAETNARLALADFDRFPGWLWRNEEIAELVEWLRRHNARVPAESAVGVYGMDLYDLFAAIDAVVAHLDSTDAATAARARRAYACLEPFRPDGERYGAASVARSCEDEVAEVVGELRRSPAEGDVRRSEGRLLALGSAEAVAGAEEFYRTMFTGRTSTWNVRDRRMAERLQLLRDHLRRRERSPRVVVWTHNTHAGDARATEAADSGDVTLGQLLRERLDRGAFLVGFFTYTGTVFAAPAWGQPGRSTELPPALPGSLADLFRATEGRAFLLPLGSAAPEVLDRPRRQRAVGVVYQPEAAAASYYFTARLARQFDAAVFLHTTSALAPLPAD